MITADEMRDHWCDRASACNQLRAYRDDVYRMYWLFYYAPDHGRRWRGRMLSRANQDLHWVRANCALCREPVDPGSWQTARRVTSVRVSAPMLAWIVNRYREATG